MSVCVREGVCACTCVFVTLKCTLLFNLDMQSFQKQWGKKIRAFLLYDSAQNTTCRLRAFSSQMSLSPQWRAWRVDAQPSDVPSLGSRGTPQPAVQSPEGCQAWLCSSNPFPLLLREQVYSLGPSSTLSTQTQPPRNCWAPSKHVLVSETFLFYGTLTYSCHIDLLLHES